MGERLFGIYEKALPGTIDWDQKTKSAKTAGFDFVELCIDENPQRIARVDLAASKARELSAIAQDNGLSMHSLCLSAHRKFPLGSLDDRVVAQSIELTKKTLDFANNIGLKVLQIAGYDVFYEQSSTETYARFRRGLRTIATLAEEHDVMLGLENVDTEMSKTIAQCMDIVNEIDSPRLEMYPDFANLSAQGVDYLTEMPKALGHIIGLHIKDTRPGQYRGVGMADGTVDFDRMFAVLREMNCSAHCVIEMWNEDCEDSTEIIRSALQFVKDRI
ncbi:MAG: L-ribulose-5-phosphate 3-epimerase [Phycisphaerae bacterium]|nr:L-ribulose-5-phosphate 3-epimerase [Phycisphaerae bacterium]